jgi:predicted enzyme related to lactoylglutathione lyase
MAAYNGGTLNANMSQVQEGVPPHWRPYFTVESVETALGRIDELGGKTLAGPIPLPEGSIAVVLDPQDAVFALFEGRVDP